MTDPFIEPDEDQPFIDEEPIRYHLDIDTGDVWEATDDKQWAIVGTVPGSGGGDGTAPSKVLNLVLVPVATYEPDGITIDTVGIDISWDAVPETDVIGYEVQVDAYDDLFAVYASLWAGGTSTTYLPALAGHQYWVRVRAYDSEGLVGPWSDVGTVTTLDDGTAPAIPSDVEAIPGYKLIAVQWTLGGETDLDHYEVQWAGDIAGVPDVDNAQTITAFGTSVIIAGLGVEVKYHARVRAVDSSGLVQTSDGDPTPVPAATNPDAGWSPWVSATTLLVGSSDLAVHALAAEFVNTGVLNANRVNTGTLTLGKTTAPGGVNVGIVVYDSLGRFIGWWDQTGMLMVNPDVPTEAMWLNAGSLKFTSAFTGFASAPNPPPAAALTSTIWTTAVTPQGINAEAITFGSSQAGHNLVPNAGFELQAYATVAETSKVFTSAADWAAGTGRINLDVSTVDLKLTAL